MSSYFYKCVKCGFETSSNEKWYKHFETKRHRLGNECFKCEECDKVYKTESSLKSHIRRVHSQKEKQLMNGLEERVIELEKMVEYLKNEIEKIKSGE